MALLDDLRALLTRHHDHVKSQTQQGTARLIEDHLKRLDTAAGADVDKADAEAHAILGDLYGAMNAPAPVIVGEPGPELAVKAAPVKTVAEKPVDIEAAPDGA